MQWFIDTLYLSVLQIFSFNKNLYEIVSLTLSVSLTALIVSIIIALPFASWLSIGNNWFKSSFVVVINSLMSFPPVLAGLLIYMLLSRRGPLGDMGLLFTPIAMILAQVLLIFPIICGLSYKVFYEKNNLLSDLFFSIGISRYKQLVVLIYESRFHLLGAIVSGLGRGLAEVGAVMIVGGNIAHNTRTITTTIALETSKGEIVVAVSLGIILLVIAIVLNILLVVINSFLSNKNIIFKKGFNGVL